MTATPTVERQHGAADVVSTPTAAGLRPEFLHEQNRGRSRSPGRQRVPRVHSLRTAKAG
jgi:hypothetical protein